MHARTASPKRKATRLSTAAPHRAEPAYPSVAVADSADAKGAALDEDATGGDAHLKLRMVPRTSTSAKRGGSARQVGEEYNIQHTIYNKGATCNKCHATCNPQHTPQRGGMQSLDRRKQVKH